MALRKMLQVLIVDDELLARQRVENLIQNQEGVEIAGQVENGEEAVAAIQRLSPDLVFLDVQMPKLSGIDVVREVGPENMPAVIFVTAYDEYALDAFELAALDYLVKPFDNERFEQALSRARETITLREAGTLQSRLKALLQEQSAEEPTASESAYLERISVDMRGQVRIIAVEDIDFIAADGSYAELHVRDDTYLIRERMQTLEDRLDPQQFMRIHRSFIVQLDRIESLLVSAGGKYAVRLKSGEKLKMSRSRREELEKRLGVDL